MAVALMARPRTSAGSGLLALALALSVTRCSALVGPPRVRATVEKPPLRACAEPPAVARPPTRPLVAASLALGLVNGGVIFGWPGLVGLLKARGVTLSPSEWARIYTIGSVAFSGSSPITGNLLDRFGPRKTSALAGALCTLAFAGLALGTSAPTLTLAYTALSIGGFTGYLASIALGNSQASRFHEPLLAPGARAKIVTTLSCLVDVSAITFIALFAVQRRLGGGAALRTPALFGAMAVATVALHTVIWHGWGQAMAFSVRTAPMAAAAPSTGSVTAAAEPPRVWAQLRTPHFGIILLFAAVHTLSSGHALAHLPARVGLAASGGVHAGAIEELASLLMTVGCLPAIPLVSACLDGGLARAMSCVNCLGLLYCALSLAPGAAPRLLSALLFAAYRGLLYSTINLFHSWVFGPAVMGRTIGAMSLLSSLPLFALQLPLFGGGAQFARAQRTVAAAVLILSAATELYTRQNRARLVAASSQSAAAA